MLEPKVIKEIKPGHYYFVVVDGKVKLVSDPKVGEKYVELPKVAGG